MRHVHKENRTAEISDEALLELAEQIGGPSLVEKIAAKLDDEEPRLARIFMLGHLDAVSTSDKPFDPKVAADFYRRLGFTAEESVKIRQSAKSQPLLT